MSALKDVSLNLRPAVMGVIAEIERCKSISEIRPLTSELRFWLDGDPLSIINSLKSRLLLTGTATASTAASAVPMQASGDTPKMIIREMEGCDQESDCCYESDGFCGGSVIDLPEGDVAAVTATVATVVTGPTVVTGQTPVPTCDVLDLSGSTIKSDEKVLSSSAAPICFDRDAC